MIRISCWVSFSQKDVQDIIEKSTASFLDRQVAVTPIYFPAPKAQRQKGAMIWTCVQDQKLSRRLSTVNMDEERKTQVVERISDFLAPESPQRYAELGIPYTLGFLFDGPPGTGKSSLAFALGGHFGLAIYCIPLNSAEITDKDLSILLAKLPTRCMLLFEDIDVAGLPSRQLTGSPVGSAVKEITLARPPVSLSALLNAMDGVATPPGIILVGTTNCSQDVDPALKRQGRLGEKVVFTLATREDMKQMFVRLYSLHTRDDRAMATEKGSGWDINSGADAFVTSLPDRTFAPADIEAFLLSMPEPDDAIKMVGAWREQRMRDEDRS